MIRTQSITVLGGIFGLSSLRLPLYECVSVDGHKLSLTQFHGLVKTDAALSAYSVCPGFIEPKTMMLESLFMTSSVLPGLVLLLALNSLSHRKVRNLRAVALVGSLQCAVSLMTIYILQGQLSPLGQGGYLLAFSGFLAILGSVLELKQKAPS